jgi:hypothetical protein
MTSRRTLYLPALIVASVLMACVAAVLAVSREAEASFPGQDDWIAYASDESRTPVFGSIYTINPGGGGKSKVTDNSTDDYGPSWGGVRSGFSSE